MKHVHARRIQHTCVCLWHACRYACIFVPLSVSLGTCVSVLSLRLYDYTYIHKCACVCLRAHVHICVSVCLCLLGLFRESVLARSYSNVYNKTKHWHQTIFVFSVAWWTPMNCQRVLQVAFIFERFQTNGISIGKLTIGTSLWAEFY